MSNENDDPDEFMPFIMSSDDIGQGFHDENMMVHQSGGFHPDAGQYVIDPDFMELLGMEDPSELIKFHK